VAMSNSFQELAASSASCLRERKVGVMLFKEDKEREVVPEQMVAHQSYKSNVCSAPVTRQGVSAGVEPAS